MTGKAAAWSKHYADRIDAARRGLPPARLHRWWSTSTDEHRWGWYTMERAELPRGRSGLAGHGYLLFLDRPGNARKAIRTERFGKRVALHGDSDALTEAARDHWLSHLTKPIKAENPGSLRELWDAAERKVDVIGYDRHYRISIRAIHAHGDDFRVFCRFPVGWDYVDRGTLTDLSKPVGWLHRYRDTMRHRVFFRWSGDQTMIPPVDDAGRLYLVQWGDRDDDAVTFWRLSDGAKVELGPVAGKWLWKAYHDAQPTTEEGWYLDDRTGRFDGRIR